MASAAARLLLGLLAAGAVGTASALVDKNEPCSPLALEVVQLVHGVCKVALAGAALTVDVKVLPVERWRGMGSTAASLVLHCPRHLALGAGAAEGEGGAAGEAPDRGAGASGALLPWDSWRICLASAAAWLLLRCCSRWVPAVLLFAAATLRFERDSSRAPSAARLGIWRRLACSQAHSIFASAAGLALVSNYEGCQLDQQLTRWHQAAFAVTLGHHLVAVCTGLAVRGASCAWTSVRVVQVLDRAVVGGLLCLCMSLRRFALAGVAFGLLFELPAMLVNVCEGLSLRQSAAALDPEVRRLYWDATLVLALLARGVPLVIYVEAWLRGWPPWSEAGAHAWHVALAAVGASSVALWLCLMAARKQDLEDLPNWRGEVVAPEPSPPPGQPSDIEATVCVGQGGGIEQDEFARQGSANVEAGGHGAGSTCCLTIHGVSYDVTGFLEEHPGGAGRLLQYAGTDATAAFEALGHSSIARELLQSIPVLPHGSGRPAAEGQTGCSGACPYNFLVQPRGTRTLISLASHVALAVLALFSARGLPGSHVPSSALLGVAAVGLAAGVSGLAVPAQAGSPRASRHALRQLRVHAAGAALALLAVALQLAATPTVGLGAVGTLLLEALRQRPPRDAASAPLSWALLALHAVPAWGVAGGGACLGWGSALVGVAAIGVSTSTLCHTAQATAGALQCVICLAGLWALAAWLVLMTFSAIVPQSASGWLWHGPDQLDAWPTALAAPCIVAGTCALLRTLVDYAGRSSPGSAASWAALFTGVSAAVCQLKDGGISAPGCLALCGWILQGRHLARLVEAEVRSSSRLGSHAAPHLHRVLFILDTARAAIALAVWGSVGRVVESLVTWMLPSGLRVFAFEAPVDDLGGRLSAGICLFLQGEQTKPGHVVCNVGHIPTADLDDVRSTVRHSLDIMRELSGEPGVPDPAQPGASRQQVPGFIANVLCVLPEAHQHRSFFGVNWRSVREVNLSVWSDEAAAAAWYRSSKAHAAILAEHAGGGLRTFGDLLLSLKPVRVAWQRRCRKCAAVVEGLESQQCPKCGGAAFELPVF